MMTLNDFEALVEGQRKVIVVDELDHRVARALRAQTPYVTLSRDTLFHVIAQHKDIRAEHFLRLPTMLANGLVIHEPHRPRFATVSWWDHVFGRRYAVPIKATESGQEIYVSTLHKMRRRQIQAALRRGTILRPHK